MAERYCSNCGHELGEDAQFCSNCGSPVHQTARVPTPEADVPVPPPPQQEEGIAASPPLQDQSTDIKEWWQTAIGKTIGILVAILVVLILLITIVVAALAGGEETGSQANKAKKEPGAQKAQEPGSGGGEDTTSKPELAVSSPSDSTTVTRDTVEVKGKVTPASSEVTVNGASVTSDKDGSFSTPFHLNVGANEIQITAENGTKQTGYYRVVTRKLSEKEIAAKKAAKKAAAKKAAAEEAAAKKAAEEAAAKKAAREAAKNAAIGDTVRVGDVEWKVTDAFLTNQLKSSFGTQKRGRFVVVDFTFTNNRDEEVTLDPELHMVLKDSSGREFGTDPGAYEFMPTDLDIFLTPVNPGVSTNGRVIYEVAPDATGFTLKLDDVEFWEDNSAVFDLSNIRPRAYEDPAVATASATASPAGQ